MTDMHTLCHWKQKTHKWFREQTNKPVWQLRWEARWMTNRLKLYGLPRGANPTVTLDSSSLSPTPTSTTTTTHKHKHNHYHPAQQAQVLQAAWVIIFVAMTTELMQRKGTLTTFCLCPYDLFQLISLTISCEKCSLTHPIAAPEHPIKR